MGPMLNWTHAGCLKWAIYLTLLPKEARFSPALEGSYLYNWPDRSAAAMSVRQTNTGAPWSRLRGGRLDFPAGLNILLCLTLCIKQLAASCFSSFGR